MQKGLTLSANQRGSLSEFEEDASNSCIFQIVPRETPQIGDDTGRLESERHKHCETHILIPTHMLRDIDIQRERDSHTLRYRHTERLTQTLETDTQH